MPRGCHAGTAQREVDVIAEPLAQRDMPAVPEVRDRLCHVGIIEVFLKLKAEHLAQADCHIGVATEIEENLQRVGQRADPQQRHGFFPVYVKSRLCHKGDIVGEQHFFAEAGDEPLHTLGEFFWRDLAVIDLFSDRAIPHDGTRDQLREERYVQRQREGVALHAGRTAVDIYYVGQRLERKKRDADRQRNAGQLQVDVQRLTHHMPKEVQIFKYKQNAQITRQRRQQPVPAPAF